MQNSKTDAEYLEKIREKIFTLLKKTPGTFEDEDYHKLRVEIKKLKAVAGFLQFSNKQFSKKKYLKAFKKVYKQAGKIRELQLEETFLKKNHNQFIEQYLSDLTSRIRKEKEKFASLLGNKRQKKIKKSLKEIADFLDKSYQADGIPFIHKERRRVSELVNELPLKPAKLHQLRKILKEDFYTRKRIRFSTPQIKAEDELLQLLGKWHDSIVLNKQFGTSILKAKINPVELSELLKINAAVSLQSEILFKEINVILKKGLF